MTECNTTPLQFPSCKRRRVEAEFRGGSISSDGGSLLLRDLDKRLGLVHTVARHLEDSRRQASCAHDLESLLRQRIFGLCLGYEDLNDHQTLRTDPALQTVLDKDSTLASAPTLCRFENRADRDFARVVHRALFDAFVASFDAPPEELILDFDATDDLVHGMQEGRFFHGYYDHYCFLPLYVTCGDHLLVSYLRASKIDAAKHAGAILKLLVHALRAVWPDVRIIFRADSGFCRHHVLDWCERNDVGYIVGIAKNNRLQTLAAELIEQAADVFEATNEKQRLFDDLTYGAKTWTTERRVIVKAEHNRLGPNTRYLVTNLTGDAQHLYDDLYCQRGDMENRIKEQQLDLFADRTSCHRWWANQCRLLLSSLAYTLMAALRRLALKNTELAHACCNTIRLKLLKIGAVILRNTRRVRFLLSSAYPHQALFRQVCAQIRDG